MLLNMHPDVLQSSGRFYGHTEANDTFLYGCASVCRILCLLVASVCLNIDFVAKKTKDSVAAAHIKLTSASVSTIAVMNMSETHSGLKAH